MARFHRCLTRAPRCKEKKREVYLDNQAGGQGQTHWFVLGHGGILPWCGGDYSGHRPGAELTYLCTSVIPPHHGGGGHRRPHLILTAICGKCGTHYYPNWDISVSFAGGRFGADRCRHPCQAVSRLSEGGLRREARMHFSTMIVVRVDGWTGEPNVPGRLGLAVGAGTTQTRLYTGPPSFSCWIFFFLCGSHADSPIRRLSTGAMIWMFFEHSFRHRIPLPLAVAWLASRRSVFHDWMFRWSGAGAPACPRAAGGAAKKPIPELLTELPDNCILDGLLAKYSLLRTHRRGVENTLLFRFRCADGCPCVAVGRGNSFGPNPSA